MEPEISKIMAISMPCLRTKSMFNVVWGRARAAASNRNAAKITAFPILCLMVFLLPMLCNNLTLENRKPRLFFTNQNR
jgi:hypothetical protein